MKDDKGSGRYSYKDILLRLNDYGAGRYYLLESFVMKLLQAEAALKGQTIEVVSSRHMDIGYDAIAHDGLGDLKGPLVISIVATPDFHKTPKMYLGASLRGRF